MKTTPQLSMADNRVQINLPLFVVLGAFLWFIGLVFIRFAGEAFFLKGGLWLLGLYLFSIPVGWLLVRRVALIGKLSGVKLLIAVVIMSFTGLLLDGVAIAWLPSLYDLPTPAHLLAAAWLLWFVGVFLYTSLIITRNEIAFEP